MKKSFEEVDAFIFDFDGVLTDNSVYVDEYGNESVRCSRADGLAFDVFHKLKKPVYIVSTEQNTVVEVRSKKLRARVLQGVSDKSQALTSIANEQGYQLKHLVYIGNDLNDYAAMDLCGLTVCPADSHHRIKERSDLVLKSSGGQGVARELLENFFGLDFIKILF